MKRLILSIAAISALAFSAYLFTTAYFTDTEQSLGNSFTTGTIDIAVDGTNPWIQGQPFQLVDMKPSQVGYIDFVIHNVGTNPANITKRIDITKQMDVITSEPECAELGGTWNDGQSTCEGDYMSRDDIDSVIRYDMLVKLYDEDPSQNPSAQPIWQQIIYKDSEAVMLSTLDGYEMYLGMLPEDYYMQVEQSYHMDADTTNWAQGDELDFNITLTAEQLKGTLALENKDSSDWSIVNGDGIQGTLTYGVKDATFDFSFTGTAPSASTNYSLIFYYESFSSPSGSGWPRSISVLGAGASDAGGNITISGSQDYGYDIRNMKVWLVRTSDIVGGQLSGWSPSSYLFETGLMDYYDSL